MAYKIIISAGALNDTNEAYAFYEHQQTELGERFLKELEQFYKKLKDHTTWYSFVSIERTIRSHLK
ncbi:MAG: hypothetical protein ABIO55_13785 [Ginsengibacter sp.]